MWSKLKAVLDELIVILKLISELLRWYSFGCRVRPSGFGVRVQIKEEFGFMGQLFTYRQGLLPAPDGVASQRLVVTVDGVAQDPIEIEAEATSVDFEAGPAGASVTLSLDYLDSAGNDSSNLEMTFDVVDGIPPDAPSGFGEMVQLSERFVPDEVPDEDPVDEPSE